MKEVFRINNSLPEAGKFQQQLESLLRNSGFSDDLTHDLSLLTEELLVNIVSYGYDENCGNREIQIEVAVEDGNIVSMEFRDDARPFDPLAAPDRDPEDERIGGWGIPLLKSFTDSVEYERQGHFNVLRLRRSERDS